FLRTRMERSRRDGEPDYGRRRQSRISRGGAQAMSAAPLCRHFGTCGGCTYQDMPDADYRAFKRASVVETLRRAGLEDAEVADMAEVGPATRRRAALKAAKEKGVTRVGFHAAASH